MKKNRKMITALSIAAGTLALGATAVAAQRGDSHEGRREARMSIHAEDTRGGNGEHGQDAPADARGDVRAQGQEGGDDVRGGHIGAEAGEDLGEGHEAHGLVRALEALAQDGSLDKGTIDALKDALGELHKANDQAVATDGPRHHMKAAVEAAISGLVADGVLNQTQAAKVLEALGALADHDAGHGMGRRMRDDLGRQGHLEEGAAGARDGRPGAAQGTQAQMAPGTAGSR